MQLLLFTNEFPNPLQPAKGMFNVQLAEALSASHSVRVISPVSWLDELRAGGSRGRIAATRRWTVRGIEVDLPRYDYPPKLMRNRYAQFLWWSVRAVAGRTLIEAPPDAVLGYWAHPDGEIAVRIARLAGVPSVVMVGGSDVLVLAREPRRRRVILKVLKSADAVVAVSQDLRQKVIELGIPAEKVHVVYRGVNRESFAPGDQTEARSRLGLAQQRKQLLWVGRLAPVKGLEVLLDACKSLARRRVDFRLHLVGDGELRVSLEARIKRNGLAEHVSLVGPVPHEELPDWFRAADLSVLPSRSEGAPNVLLESIACGTPFVASRVGGIPEIADDRYDRLVAPGDAAELAEAIEDVLARSASGPRCAGPRRFEPRSWAESAEELEHIIERLRCSMGSPRLHAVPGCQNGDVHHAAAKSPWRQMARRGMARMLPRKMLLVRGSAHSSAVCLTFDDGPHPEHTPGLLDVLHRLDVRATFFVIGERAAANPDIVRRIEGEGHAIGHHSYYHYFGYTSAKMRFDGIDRTQRLFNTLLGRHSTLFRPPFGKLTAADFLKLWRRRQTVVLWNADPKDYARSSPAEVALWFREHPLAAGDVVLLHDVVPFAAEVLPQVVEDARRRGLKFATVQDWVR